MLVAQSWQACLAGTQSTVRDNRVIKVDKAEEEGGREVGRINKAEGVSELFLCSLTYYL